jgi:hypothetical protein
LALGSGEIAILILLGIIVGLFIPLYIRLCRTSRAKRSHKVIYPLVLLGLVILLLYTIFVLHYSVEWNEVLILGVNVPMFFFIMLHDLGGDLPTVGYPFGLLFLTAGLMVATVICGVFIIGNIFNLYTVGVLLLPLHILLLLILALGCLLVLVARGWGKVEKKASGGRIISGGRAVLLVLGVTFGLVLIVTGILLFIGSPTIHRPSDLDDFIIVSAMLISGTILLGYCIPKLNAERRKRLAVGFY